MLTMKEASVISDVWLQNMKYSCYFSASQKEGTWVQSMGGCGYGWWVWVVGRDGGNPDEERGETDTYLEGESGSGPVAQPVTKEPLRISLAKVSQNLSCLQ